MEDLMAEDLTDQTMDNYELLRKLGEGGMGSVYQAKNRLTGEEVALKVLHSELSRDPANVARFRREAEVVKAIGHSNIVDVIHIGFVEIGLMQLLYLAMEYLVGVTLAQLIQAESPLAPERVLRIVLQTANALSAAHRCGVVHRDLKPSNIMLVRRNHTPDFVQLLDWGIAKLTRDQKGPQLTRAGALVGSPYYMAPEQIDGRGIIDQRADIYALGITAYEALVGHVPFTGDDCGTVLRQHLWRPPPRPSQYRTLDPHLEAIVLKALEKDPDLRFPMMDEMIRAMLDPVGYVEAHGGIAGFGQRRLMPSNALTPSLGLPPRPRPRPMPGVLPVSGGPAAQVPTASPVAPTISVMPPAPGQARTAADAFVKQGNELLRLNRPSEAKTCYGAAVQIDRALPSAWEGLGYSFLALGRRYDAERAFARAVGLAPRNAMALWDCALAYVELGPDELARQYLLNALVLEPGWLDAANGVPKLAALLDVSARAGLALRRALGSFSARSWRHTRDGKRIEVGLIANQPCEGFWTYVTIGLSNYTWRQVGRPRVELLLLMRVDDKVYDNIILTIALHLAETGSFPGPGVMVPDIVGALDASESSTSRPHVLFTVPRAWSIEVPLDRGSPEITVAQIVFLDEADYQRRSSTVPGASSQTGAGGAAPTRLGR
jgi:serine/threonine protein kinase